MFFAHISPARCPVSDSRAVANISLHSALQSFEGDIFLRSGGARSAQPVVCPVRACFQSIRMPQVFFDVSARLFVAHVDYSSMQFVAGPEAPVEILVFVAL